MMWRSAIGLLVLAGFAGCTTPYRPPVFVQGAPPFPGLVGLVEASGQRPVDVILVHGMCTHSEHWAHEAIDRLMQAVDSNYRRPEAQGARSDAAPATRIVPVERTESLAGGRVNFTALVWSPLTTPLKRQLAYDATGEPTDCSAPGECKPRRAKLNGRLKDGLMNDCLADALVYQGDSRAAIQRAMVEAIGQVLEASQARAQRARVPPGPLVLVSESLGSKLAFDALSGLLERERTAVEPKVYGVDRLALVFMGANQLPILGLADQDIDAIGELHTTSVAATARAPKPDALQRLLREVKVEKQRQAARVPGPSAPARIAGIHLVAFTDPNDLLSYRLQSSRYAGPDVSVADVLVSNDPTYLGLLERPDTAHKGYAQNPDVASLIACGNPRSPSCR